MKKWQLDEIKILIDLIEEIKLGIEPDPFCIRIDYEEKLKKVLKYYKKEKIK